MFASDALFQVFDIESQWITTQERRLDASFYAESVIASRFMVSKLEEKGIQVKKIEDLSVNIFWPGRFKRRYVSKEKGDPFLMPSEAIMFLPKSRKFILDYPKNVSIRKNWLLITRSGSIGRCIIATKLMEEFVLSDDLIRIVPKDENNLGYLYAYLNTWVGQTLLTKDQYGATVKHIEPHHVSFIPIPIVPGLEKEINKKILEAHRLREKAQELLLKAEEMLYSKLGLLKIDENEVKYFGGEGGKIVKAFEIKESDLTLRLDASYYAPILKLIKKVLNENAKNNKYTVKKLGDKDKDLAEIFDLPTYKRIYVKSNEGLPVLSGAHLKQIKLWDLKYISPQAFYKRGKSHLEKYKVKEGWILTTERGTTGISCLVSKIWDNWVASHNILRIVPKAINAGYLLAYLNTDYAQLQLKSKEFGAVVEVLDPRDMRDLILPVPDKTIQEKIGNLVFEAYNKRDKSNQIEDEAIRLLEKRLKEIAEGNP